MVTFQSSPSIRRHPTIRRSIFLCNTFIFWSWNLDIGSTAIQNKSAEPTQASKYFNLKCENALWSSNIDLCLWKDAQATRCRFLNSIFIRLEADVKSRRPRYLWESSSPKTLTKSPPTSEIDCRRFLKLIASHNFRLLSIHEKSDCLQGRQQAFRHGC